MATNVYKWNRWYKLMGRNLNSLKYFLELMKNLGEKVMVSRGHHIVTKLRKTTL